MAWIGYKRTLKSIPSEWVLKILNILKLISEIITFLKYDIDSWLTNLRLIHEKHILKINYLNINNGFFQGDSFSLLFCWAQILFIEIKNTKHGYKTTTNKINHIFYMEDLKLYAKNGDYLEVPLRTVKSFSDDMGSGQLGLDNSHWGTAI